MTISQASLKRGVSRLIWRLNLQNLVFRIREIRMAWGAEANATDDRGAPVPPPYLRVQVAGGANEGSLPKEWEKVRAKAPVAFKGKSGWTTPLRATNRVLAGPFKTNDEARSFVNALAKEGISAFTFNSDAGQKIVKLAIK